MREFKDTKGNVVTFDQIRDTILEDENHEYEIFVGSDSQVHKKIKKVIYSTCIILYKKGKGGRVFICRERERYANSLRERLMKETWRSIEAAFELKEIMPSWIELVVHVDVNKKKKWKSSQYLEELVGMVVGQGFKFAVKPTAWAAQSVADKFAR